MVAKKQSYNNKTDAHKWRTEIPNVVFDMGLSPSAVCLYGYIKRTAGDKGKCWKSISTLEKESGMCHNLVVKAKKELVKRSLIKVVKVPNKHGGFPCDEIYIVDIWADNYQHFDKPKDDDDDSGYSDTSQYPTFSTNPDDNTWTKVFPSGITVPVK